MFITALLANIKPTTFLADTGCNAGLDVVKGACEPDNDCARVLQERNGKPRAHLAFSGCDSWVLQLNPTPADVMQAKVACGASITADAPSPGGADMTNVTLTDPSTDDTTTGSSAQAPGSSESTSTTAEGPGIFLSLVLAALLRSFVTAVSSYLARCCVLGGFGWSSKWDIHNCT